MKHLNAIFSSPLPQAPSAPPFWRINHHQSIEIRAIAPIIYIEFKNSKRLRVCMIQSIQSISVEYVFVLRKILKQGFDKHARIIPQTGMVEEKSLGIKSDFHLLESIIQQHYAHATHRSMMSLNRYWLFSVR